MNEPSPNNENWFLRAVHSFREPICVFWLGAALLFSTVLSLYGIWIAFQNPYVLQDDARQYAPLLYRYWDSELFRSDLILQYYESITPSGYKALFQWTALFGVDPVGGIKVLPLFLGLITTFFCFLLALRMTHTPFGAFVAATLLNQNLWTREDISSATPRSFAYPLFTAFCYYFFKKSRIGCFILLVLQCLFFPPVALVSLAMLAFRAVRLEPGMRISGRAPGFWIVCLSVAVLLLSPYSISSSAFGPVVSRAEAKTMIAFMKDGSQPFFLDPLQYWITGPHSGFIPYDIRPPLIWTGLLILFFLKHRYGGRAPLPARSETTLFQAAKFPVRIIVASTCVFLPAHAFLFHLYNPGRYTQHTFPVALALASGVVVVEILRRVHHVNRLAGKVLVFVLLTILAAQSVNTLLYGYGYRQYLSGKYRDLYSFFHKQQPSTLTASLSAEADNLPAFGRRSTLAGREYALPYHTAYYSQIHGRVSQLIRAHYSEDPGEVRKLIRVYYVDFFLIEKGSLTLEWLRRPSWIHEYQPAAKEAVLSMESGKIPALQALLPVCTVFENRDFAVVDAKCVLNKIAK